MKILKINYLRAMEGYSISLSIGIGKFIIHLYKDIYAYGFDFGISLDTKKGRRFKNRLKAVKQKTEQRKRGERV